MGGRLAEHGLRNDIGIGGRRKWKGLASRLQYLFGKDAWKCGDSNSCNDRYLEEQGFTSGSSVGHIMRVDKESKNGVTYNIYDVLTRYADGSQGGRWHMISAASKGGKTYVAHFVAGEKHWTKNKAIAEKVRSSLNVTA